MKCIYARVRVSPDIAYGVEYVIKEIKQIGEGKNDVIRKMFEFYVLSPTRCSSSLENILSQFSKYCLLAFYFILASQIAVSIIELI